MSERSKQINKPELLERIRTERARLEGILARMTVEQMLLPGASGEWTVKDVLAHILAWEGWMVRWTDMHLRGEAPDVPPPWDVERMNAETYALVKDKPLAEVLEEFHQSYQAALALAESLSEDQLQTTYTDTWPMGTLWLGVAANTFWHYKQHREDIQVWPLQGASRRLRTPASPGQLAVTILQ